MLDPREAQIPRPEWNGMAQCRSLRRVPRLSVDDRVELKRVLPLEIPLYLDVNLAWYQQSAEQRVKFLTEMTARFPCMANYEDAWPVEVCTKEWLSQRRQRKKREAEKSQASRTVQSTMEMNVSISVRQVSVSLPCPNQLAMQKSHPNPGYPSSSSRDINSVPAAAPSNATSSTSVRRFLASLRPSMQEMEPVLALGGIRNRECLQGLITMNNDQQRAFLERLPLNLFQREVLCDGLAAHRH